MRMLLGAGGLGCAAALSLAAADGARMTRAIQGEAAATAVVAVPLDDPVFAHTQPQWADLRVTDADGRDIPRAVEPERAYRFEERHVEWPALLKSVEQLPDGGLAVVCELEGTNALTLTRLTVRTPLRDYEQSVTVSIRGADGAWVPLRTAEPLYDYSRYADVKKESVTLPNLTNRLFKLVIARADDRVFSAYASMIEERDAAETRQRTFKRYDVEQRPFRIDAVIFRDSRRVAVADTLRTERLAVPAFTVEEQRERKQTVLTVEAAQWPLTGLVLQPDQQNFDRRVTVSCDAPGGWRELAAGRLTRVRLPDTAPVEQCEIALPETRAARLRVVIENNDNPPLTFAAGSVSALRQAYRALFIAEPGARYALVYGNPEPVAVPVYEQSVLNYLRGGRQAQVWPLAAAPDGGLHIGAAVRVRRFFARHGLLLVSLAVMAALALLILRAVRRLPTS
ncbi:MAG TPA: hypothetical protein PLW27_04520 [Kiritimatiellia bacterium]|nr:hypothetical protein [Kiritimatiellia bacterium]HQA38146.1 hypothetical protein [Kiritimatiellia bacterium]